MLEVEVVSRGVVGFDSSPNPATKHVIYEQCLPPVLFFLLEQM